MKDLMRCVLVLAVVLPAATGALLAQPSSAPAWEDVLVTDPTRLQELGLAPDATNVYERIYFADQEALALENPEPLDGFGPNRWFTTEPGRFFHGREAIDDSERDLGQNEGIACAPGGGTATFEQDVEIPMGSLLTGYRWWADDNTATGQIQVRIWRGCHPDFAAGNVTFTLLTTDSTGVAFAGGNFSSFVTGLNETMDNGSCYYFLQAFHTECLAGLSFSKVRYYWNRQASPAPAFATFNDVPVGHPQHRFVEALFAAGITAGCGGGNYCPDAPLTRGQMAVFLSGALGLFWGF